MVNAFSPDRAFLLLFAVACFGPMFTWFVIFLTHLRFRRAHRDTSLAFRAWGFPVTTLLGAALMLAALLSTPFTPAFRPTLLYGLPFLALLTLAFHLKRR